MTDRHRTIVTAGRDSSRRGLAWAGVIGVVMLCGWTLRPAAPEAAASTAGEEEPVLTSAAAPRAGEKGGEGAAPAGLLRRIGRLHIPGAEIVDYDAGANLLLVSAEGGWVEGFHLGDGVSPVRVYRLNAAEASGLAPGLDAEVTHLAVDPAGRGFGVATVAPVQCAAAPGSIVFFSTRSGRAFASIMAGFNPDAAKFTPDGSRLIVANEGQPEVLPGGNVSDPPGSVTVVRIGGPGAGGPGAAPFSVSQSDAFTVWLHGPALGAALAKGTSITDPALPRIAPTALSSAAADLEPESIAVDRDGSRAWVTLQENNAIAVLNLRTLSLERIAPLGVFWQTIDASDKDGGPKIDTLFPGLPMPDQIVTVRIGGRTYLVTANEGDARGEVKEGALSSPIADSGRLAKVAPRAEIASGAERLMVCAFSGDTDGDGAIDRPVMLGTRSVTVWDAETLAPVSDTGSMFERAMAAAAPSNFNASEPGRGMDGRSSQRGPEPEGLAAGTLDGRTVVFVTLERPGAVATLDISDPREPRLVDLHVSALEGDTGPEGVVFIEASRSPTGEALLVVAYERSGTVAVYRVGNSGAEPATARAGAGTF